MPVDERDPYLAQLLDRAVAPWEPTLDPRGPRRRGRRRRAGQITAGVAVVSLFIGAIAWTGAQMRGAPDVLGSLSDEGWTMRLPAGWSVQSIARCDGADGTIGDGVIVSSATFAFRDPAGGAPSCEDRFVFDGFPGDAVALSIEPVGTRLGLGVHDQIGTPLPLEPGILAPTDEIRGGPSMSYAPIRLDGHLVAFVRRWVGSEADPATIDVLDQTLASIDVRDAVRWIEGAATASGPGTVSFRYPSDWTLSEGEWPITFTSAGVNGASNCVWGDNPGQLNAGAVLFVTDMLDASGPTPAPSDLAARPDALTWSDADGVDEDARCGGEPMTRGVWRFALGGRDVSAYLALGGPGRDETTARIALAAIASLRFSDPLPPDRTYETVGDQTTLVDVGDAFSVSYPDGWFPSEVPVNTWVSSPREILALATYPLRPGGEAVIDAQVPSRAMEDLGPSDAFIWVNDGGSADGPTPERPRHFGPAAVCADGHLCPDAEGRSLGIDGARAWWIYFQDGGRLIYVFVAIGEEAFHDPTRAAEPWAILDSLVFEPRPETS